MRARHTTILLTTLLLISACARVSAPQGGPKDLTPPNLVSSVPNDGQTLYKGNTILLVFDEPVTTKSIETKLIITPSIKGTFKTKTRRNTIQLTFDSAFNENTTYTLNFGSTITDVNESNIPKNLYLSFATGNQIDSLTLSGQVRNLYTSEPIEDALVSIYPDSDSLNITSGPASYYTKTDSLGNYQFRNLPSGNFMLYAVLDKNSNLKADTEKELYGFYLDTIRTEDNPTNKSILLQKLNTTPLSIKTARHFAQYFEVAFNKSITTFSAEALNSDSLLYHKKDTDKIRFYNLNNTFGDSTRVIITANDSINTNLRDTVQLYFNSSELPLDKLNIETFPTQGTVSDTIPLKITFNKPILQYFRDSVAIKKDTINTYTLPDSLMSWNSSRTSVQWNLLTQDYITKGERLNIQFNKATFISIENDSSARQQKTYQQAKSEDSGLISGKISIDTPYFIVQLLGTTGKVLREVRNTKSYSFSGLDAGNYQVRLIVDTNNNGKLDIGNLLNRTEPEEIAYYYNQLNKTKNITLKKNWEIGEIDINYTVNK
jgi:uncharacterized protein (DUF2141 family)